MDSRTLLFSISILVAACGGNSGGDNDSGLKTGVFTDSPVAGLRYDTATQSGLTTVSGEFNYRTGETVSFSLGGITVGSATAAETLTPLDLVQASSIDAAARQGVKDRLINILLLLQSLDRDHNPDNGIDLTGLDEALDAETLDLSLPLNEVYSSGLQRIIHTHQGFLQTPRAAQNHFMAAQGLTVSVEYPSVDFLDNDGDGEIDREIRYGYNTAGGLATITEIDAQTAQTLSTSSSTYDINGHLARTDYKKTTHPEFGYSDLFEYDNAGRLLRHSHLEDDGSIRIERENTYDAMGKIIRSRSETSAFFTPLDPPYLSLPLRHYFEFIPVIPDLRQAAMGALGFGIPGLPFSDRLLLPGIPIAVAIEDIDFPGDGVIFNPDFINAIWWTITDTTYVYDEQGELIETTMDRTNIPGLNPSYVPLDSQTVTTYQDGLLINRKVSYSNDIQPPYEDRFEYSPRASITRCESLQNGVSVRVKTFEDVPGEVIRSHFGCHSLERVLLTRNDDGQITRREEERLFVVDAAHWHKTTAEFDYEQGRVSEFRFDLGSDGEDDITYRYQYTDSGLLKRREMTNSSRDVRTREFLTMTLDAVP